MPDTSKVPGDMNRRAALKGISAATVAGGLGAVSGSLSPTAAAGQDAKDMRRIDGYASPQSVKAGDEIELCISTNLSKYSIEIARIGGQRDVVWRKDELLGVDHPTPDDAALFGCKWPAAIRMRVPEDWRSGYYQATMRGSGSDGKPVHGELFFVVRPLHPGQDTKILIQLCTNTYAAYNFFGDCSLYGHAADKLVDYAWKDGRDLRGRRVSLDRPYLGFPQYRGGYPDFTRKYSGWHNWEVDFVRWAEREGYVIDFCANEDLEHHPEILKPYRLVLSVGHDEYWSSPMRDSLEAFIAEGGNAAFFSGNTCFWQVRFESDGHAMVCWKDLFEKDPLYGKDDNKLLATMWSNRMVGRSENELTGVSFTWAGYSAFAGHFEDGPFAYKIHRPDHWIFEGTGLKQGELLGAKERIVGYECDGCSLEWRDGLPYPTYTDGTPKSFEILGTCPAGVHRGGGGGLDIIDIALYGKIQDGQHPQPGTVTMGVYTQGGTVFTSGCTEWSRGLKGKNPQVERITHNILRRLSSPIAGG